jgi:hypothetical protein
VAAFCFAPTLVRRSPKARKALKPETPVARDFWNSVVGGTGLLQVAQQHERTELLLQSYRAAGLQREAPLFVNCFQLRFGGEFLEARIIPERIERALPGNLATLNAMARLHKHQGKAILAANGSKSRLDALLQMRMKLWQQRKNSTAKS